MRACVFHMHPYLSGTSALASSGWGVVRTRALASEQPAPAREQRLCSTAGQYFEFCARELTQHTAQLGCSTRRPRGGLPSIW